jgi:hypothetical protein
MHPCNKHDRFVKGKRKGKKRAAILLIGNPDKKLREKLEHFHRDTTKLCGGVCCANPRKHFKSKTKQEVLAEQDCKTVDILKKGINDEEV